MLGHGLRRAVQENAGGPILATWTASIQQAHAPAATTSATMSLGPAFTGRRMALLFTVVATGAASPYVSEVTINGVTAEIHDIQHVQIGSNYFFVGVASAVVDTGTSGTVSVTRAGGQVGPVGYYHLWSMTGANRTVSVNLNTVALSGSAIYSNTSPVTVQVDAVAGNSLLAAQFYSGKTMTVTNATEVAHVGSTVLSYGAQYDATADETPRTISFTPTSAGAIYGVQTGVVFF